MVLIQVGQNLVKSSNVLATLNLTINETTFGTETLKTRMMNLKVSFPFAIVLAFALISCNSNKGLSVEDQGEVLIEQDS
ncbi:hypothetical protein N9Y89_01740 [bacterium]|nr:hypothetical protein [bacterium]